MLKKRRRHCAYCKNRLEHHKGRPKKFCTAACRQAAYRRRPEQRFPALRLLRRDLQTAQEKDAKIKELVDKLNILLLPSRREVYFGPLSRRPKPLLSVVPSTKPQS
jgi:hypothetical protein